MWGYIVSKPRICFLSLFFLLVITRQRHLLMCERRPGRKVLTCRDTVAVLFLTNMQNLSFTSSVGTAATESLFHNFHLLTGLVSVGLLTLETRRKKQEGEREWGKRTDWMRSSIQTRVVTNREFYELQTCWNGVPCACAAALIGSLAAGEGESFHTCAS